MDQGGVEAFYKGSLRTNLFVFVHQHFTKIQCVCTLVTRSQAREVLLTLHLGEEAEPWLLPLATCSCNFTKLSFH